MTGITIEPVDDLDCRVIRHDWAFARERAAEIKAHWEEQLAAGRKLWNGRVMLAYRPRIVMRGDQRVFVSDHFETDFAAFLAFRDFGFPDPQVHNCFAMAALRSSDGAFLLARMSAQTANAGQVYFAAGTPDPGDVRGTRLDLAGSVFRELTEETGLTADDVIAAPGYAAVLAGGRIALMRDVRTHAPAAEVIARVSAFLSREKDPEIESLLAVHTGTDIISGTMPDFIQAYLRDRLAAMDQPPPG